MSPAIQPESFRATVAAYFKRDLLASVVVFLVALPLCMGIAIASGVPPAAGLVTGIVGGLIVGTIAGSPLQVSGPAAGLAVIVWELVQRHGLTVLGPIVIVAGILQIAAGIGRVGRWFQAVPPSVVYGMLAGIGALIFASQFHVMVDDKPKGSGMMNLVAIPLALYKGIVPSEGLPHREAAMIGLITIAIIVVWNGPLAKRFRSLKPIPGALPAVLVATGLANAFSLPIARVAIPHDLLGTLTTPTAESLSKLLDPAVLGAAFALAIIASAETLLCATALDRMHSGPRTKYDRELLAQGIGNTLCGLVGALPMTGVIVRSSANVEAGARTRLSTILHGTWLLVLVALAPFVLSLIPIASLAALLVFTGYKLMRQDLRALRKGGRSEVFIYFATIAGIVATDLLKGVLIGLGLALAKLVWKLTHLRIRVEHSAKGPHTTVHLAGSATFLRLPSINSVLGAIPTDREVHIQLDEVNYIDHAALEAIAAWEKQHMSRGGKVSLDWKDLALREKLAPRAVAAQEPTT